LSGLDYETRGDSRLGSPDAMRRCFRSPEDARAFYNRFPDFGELIWGVNSSKRDLSGVIP
jgi:hypothetical protein